MVSWMWSFDPYTFYVPQTTIAAKREPFEIDQFDRVQTLLQCHEAKTYQNANGHFEGPKLINFFDQPF